MKKSKVFKIIAIVVAISLVFVMLCGFSSTAMSAGSSADTTATINIGNKLAENQPTPTDIEYSLERYNLIRRAYVVNGQEEKAASLPCPVEKPLGYIALFLEGVGVVSTHIYDGKVSSLNSFLSPDSEYYEQEYGTDGYSYGDGNNWLPDVDGSYGENDSGIFFFDENGEYWEWNSVYLLSNSPFEFDEPMLKVVGADG